MSKLYVSNLSYTTTVDDLRAAVEKVAHCMSVDVVRDRMTGQSRGFAFVEVVESAEVVIEALNGAELQGRRLVVNEARSMAVFRPFVGSDSQQESDSPVSGGPPSSVFEVRGGDDAEEQRFALDWAYAYRNYAGGAFQSFRGQFVGIYQERVIGTCDSEEALRQSFADAHRGSPDQLVVLWVDQNDIR